MQGTVTFTPVEEAGGGEVAVVSFEGLELKGVSSLYFILNSAWSQNAVSPYRKGERVVLSTLLDGTQEWICLTEAKQGKQGILYHIGKESIDYNSYINTYASQNEHSREETEWIAAELKDAGIYGKVPSDLEFVDIFKMWKKLRPQLKEAGGIPLRNAAYWTSTEQYYYDSQMLVFDWDSYRIDVGLKMYMGYRVRAMLAF